MKEYYFIDDKVKLYYRKNKFMKSRETIVFIQGATGSSAGWIPYERIFENRFNILSFDIRGHGKSFRPKKLRDYQVQNFAEDLHKLLKFNHINNFFIIAHSFGNFISFNFLKYHENMVKGAIFVSPDYSTLKNRLAARILRPFIYFGLLVNLFPLYKGSGNHVDYTKYPPGGDWYLPRAFADARNTGIRSYINTSFYSSNYDGEDILKKLKIPVLIVHGKKDTIFPYYRGVHVKELIKNSKLLSLKNADHIIVLNNIKELSKAIEDFTTEITK